MHPMVTTAQVPQPLRLLAAGTVAGMLGWLVALAVSATALPAFASPASPAERVGIRYLAQGKKVIPVSVRIGGWEITDIKLPDLVATNAQESPVTVEQVEVVVKAAGADALRLTISGKPLADAIVEFADIVNNQQRPLPALQLAYGNIALPEGKVSDNGTLAGGQSLVLPLSKIAFVHLVGHTKVDELEIRLTVATGGERTVAAFPVALTPYQVTGRYMFPLKGDVQMAFLPLSYIHHRAAASQEFAMDLVGANQKDAASFTDISRPNPMALTDYGIWGREVHAVGDGLVVETGDRFPEKLMSDPVKFNQPDYVRGVLKELIPQIGWTNAVAGNYVVIDHFNGEFSVYCHLQEGSIRVRTGDKARKGMVIARVGNTGNSSAPHLHFQLMDGQSFFTANGLPMMFGNVPARAMIVDYPVTANTLSFSDSIFYTVP
jgi:hypothetical protein